MKLRFYALLMQLADFICEDLHRTERHAQRLREWAWIRCTNENLKTCNTRSAERHN